MKKIKKLLAALTIATLTFSLAGCGGSSTTSTSQTSNSSKILKAQVDVEIASMDPQIATEGTSFDAIAAVTDGLYQMDSEGKPKLALAEKVDKSEDGLTYTFTLRDAKWSNGTAVTANDGEDL